MKYTNIILIAIILLAFFLRTYKADQIPHGLYIDEISIAYNAYTILQTGKDEHGNAFPLFFQAFGEYKMPVMNYATAISMAAFGKTEFAVRLPSILAGVGSVILIYFLLRDILYFDKKIIKTKLRNIIPLTAALLLAITPWHIQFSRAGFEATIALFLYLLGGLLYLRFRKHNNYWILFFSFAAFCLTAYTYNAFRIAAPMTLLIAFLHLYKTYASKYRKKLIFVAVTAIVMLIPIFTFSFSDSGAARYQQTSAFAEGAGELTGLEKIIRYPIIYVNNYLSYFSFPYLFSTGDGFGRHTVRGMGPMFRWEIIFYIIGFYWLIKSRSSFLAKIVILLLIIAPISGAFARPSPHLLRSILLVVPLTIITTLGLSVVLAKKNKIIKIFLLAIILFAIYEFSYYTHLYYKHYPSITALDWGAEKKELILTISKYREQYKYIVIHDAFSPIDIYIAFYDHSIEYSMADNAWEKPSDWKTEKVLYITTSDMKKNSYILTVPAKKIAEIQALNKRDIYAQFWEI